MAVASSSGSSTIKNLAIPRNIGALARPTSSKPLSKITAHLNGRLFTSFVNTVDRIGQFWRGLSVRGNFNLTLQNANACAAMAVNATVKRNWRRAARHRAHPESIWLL
jgi:hypothetical protein